MQTATIVTVYLKPPLKKSFNVKGRKQLRKSLCTVELVNDENIVAGQYTCTSRYVPSWLVKMEFVLLSPHPTAVQALTETV